LDWLYQTQVFGVKLGLDSMFRLSEALGLDLRRPGFLHVAGTNGKGSTCAFLDSIGREAGLNCGLYTSPHLVSFRERIRVGGGCIPEDAVTEGLERIRRMVEWWNPHPTFFEITTALALWWFQERGTEWAILETGLGGRLDATNVVHPMVSVLTAIGMDHQQVLGEKLGQIAREKAGILKRGVGAVSVQQDPEAAQVLVEEAERRGTLIRWVERPWEGGVLGLRGRVQRWNAALAVAALEAAGVRVAPDVLDRGLAEARWPGRFEVFSTDLILDGAHNAPAASVLAQTWGEVFPGEKASLIFGVLADKDVSAVFEALRPIAAEVILVPVRSPRALPVERVRALLLEKDPQIPCRIAASLEEALGKGGSNRRLVCGSLYLVGEALGLLRGELPEWSAQ
jgi:dihydrofolate synthase/folylpolyglutamate synthase